METEKNSQIATEIGTPVIVNDLGKVARFMGETDPARLTEKQVAAALTILGHDASIVIWDSREAGR